MIDQYHICDDQQLLEILHSDTDHYDDSRTLEHIEGCVRCQNRLSELAADEIEWKRTAEVLSSNACDQAIGEGSVETALHIPNFNLQSIAWTDSMAEQLLSPPTHPEMLGRIGRYDVERLIGSGGMGVVFKAYDTELNRPVAVKLLAPYLASSGAARSRFAREARAAAAVVDEHVVSIHNVESDDERPFLVMKYIAGGSLQQRLDREGPLDVCEVLRIGIHTARGLAAAHTQGLIHRDVKPSNILLDEGVDRALLTDFGLARATDDASLTRSGFHPGTPHYMSPEQVRGEEIDGRSDLFSLGCVLYALCTGHPPFRADTSYAVLRRITDDTPRSIRELNPDIPEWLEQVVMKLLAKTRNDRFESAEQVAELLEDCLAHLQNPTTTLLPDAVAILAPKRSKRSPWFNLIAAALLGFAMLFAGTIIYLETGEGTIRIETNSQSDIPVVIRQGDKVVEHLTVSQDGTHAKLRAGNYIIEVEGDDTRFAIKGNEVTMSRGGTWIATIREKNVSERKHADAVNPLIGSWRVIDFIGDEKERLTDNIVLTFDEWTATWWDETSTEDRYIYRILPDNTLHLVETSETSTGGEEFRHRYTMPTPDTLHLQLIDTDNSADVYAELKRIIDPTKRSAYVSCLFQIYSNDGQEVHDEELLKTQMDFIRTEEFLAKVKLPEESDALIPPKAKSPAEWLRKNLWLKPAKEGMVEIGMHGHIRTKQQRLKIIATLVDAYRQWELHPAHTSDSLNNSENVETIPYKRLQNLPANTQVHVVGCYQAKDHNPIDVKVSSTGKPMVVVLNSYFAASWNLHIDPDADVRGVILAGYFDQRFSHRAPKKVIPTIVSTFFPLPEGSKGADKAKRMDNCFYVWSPLEEKEFAKMQTVLQKMTGRQLTTFQSIYTGEDFVIDGLLGTEELVIAKRWQAFVESSDTSSIEFNQIQGRLKNLGTSDDSPTPVELLDKKMDEHGVPELATKDTASNSSSSSTDPNQLVQLNILKVEDELVVVSPGEGEGLKLGQQIHSHFPESGSLAKVYKFSSGQSWARIIKDDPEYPFIAGQMAHVQVPFDVATQIYRTRTEQAAKPTSPTDGAPSFPKSGERVRFSGTVWESMGETDLPNGISEDEDAPHVSYDFDIGKNVAYKRVQSATITLYKVSPIPNVNAGYQFEEIERYKTNAKGRFLFTVPEHLRKFIPEPATPENPGTADWEALLWVTFSAPGLATDSRSLQTNADFSFFPLVQGTTISGRLLDEQGRPIVGARVTVNEQSRPSADRLDSWLKKTSPETLPPLRIDPTNVEAVLATRQRPDITRNSLSWIPTQLEGVITDDEGRFTIDGVGLNDVLDLSVGSIGRHMSSIKVVGRDITTVYALDPFGSGENIAVHGRKFTQHTLPIHGQDSPNRFRVIHKEMDTSTNNKSEANHATEPKMPAADQNQPGIGAPTPVTIEMVPHFSGKDLTTWFAEYRNQVRNGGLGSTDEAMKAIKVLSQQPANESLVVNELTKLFNETKNEFNPEVIDKHAALIVQMAGKRHQEFAVELLFKLADIREMPTEAAEWEWYRDGAGDEYKPIPFKEAVTAITTWDRTLAQQIAKQVTTSSRRVLVYIMLMGRVEDLAEADEEGDWLNQWWQGNADILLPALSDGLADPQSLARHHSLFLTWITRASLEGKDKLPEGGHLTSIPEDAELIKRFEKLLLAETDGWVMQWAWMFSQALSPDNAAISKTQLAWARSSNPEHVEAALLSLEEAPDRAVDEISELLKDPQWGLTEIPLTKVFDANVTCSRDCAIVILGSIEKNVELALEVLENEAKSDNPQRKKLAERAIKAINATAQPEDASKDVSALPKLVPWTILVLDKGRPIQGATVVVSGLRTVEEPGAHWGWPVDVVGKAPVVKSDENGHAVVLYPQVIENGHEVEDVGKLTVAVSHPQYVSMAHDFPVNEDGEAALETGSPMIIRAVDAGTMQPITEFGAYPEDWETSATWALKDGQLLTDSMQRNGETLMLVSLGGDQPRRFSELLTIDKEMIASQAPLSVPMTTGFRIEGKLDDKVPRPVVNGRVVVGTKFDKARGMHWYDYTDVEEDGTFVIESMPNGSILQIMAYAEGWHCVSDGTDRGFVHGMTYQPQHPVLEVVVPMQKSATIDVTVVDENDVLVPNLEIYTWENQRWFHHGATRAGEGFRSVEWLKLSMNGVNDFPFSDWISSAGVTTNQGIAQLQNVLNTGSYIGIAIDSTEFYIPEMTSNGRYRSNFDIQPGQSNDVTLRVKHVEANRPSANLRRSSDTSSPKAVVE